MGNCCRPFGEHRVSERRKKKIVLLLVGLDNAGKTSAAKNLLGESLESVVPTVGFNAISLSYREYSVKIYDLGGGPQIRGIWHRYFVDVHGIIFVVDSSDVPRLDETRHVLREMLANEKLAGKPVLLLANKQDRDGALDELDIVERLGLEALVNEQRCPTLVETCSTTVVGKPRVDPAIHNGYTWLLNTVIQDYARLNARVSKDTTAQGLEDEAARRLRRQRAAALRAERGLTEDTTQEEEGDPFRPIAAAMEGRGKVARLDPVMDTRVILVAEPPGSFTNTAGRTSRVSSGRANNNKSLRNADENQNEVLRNNAAVRCQSPTDPCRVEEGSDEGDVRCRTLAGERGTQHDALPGTISRNVFLVEGSETGGGVGQRDARAALKSQSGTSSTVKSQSDTRPTQSDASSTLKNQSVTSSALKSQSDASSAVKNQSVTSSAVKNQSVTSSAVKSQSDTSSTVKSQSETDSAFSSPTDVFLVKECRNKTPVANADSRVANAESRVANSPLEAERGGIQAESTNRVAGSGERGQRSNMREYVKGQLELDHARTRRKRRGPLRRTNKTAPLSPSSDSSPTSQSAASQQHRLGAATTSPRRLLLPPLRLPDRDLLPVRATLTVGDLVNVGDLLPVRATLPVGDLPPTTGRRPESSHGDQKLGGAWLADKGDVSIATWAQVQPHQASSSPLDA